MRAVNIITTEMTTSVAESMPSPSTARLPAKAPTVIFAAESTALPTVLIQEVLTSTLLRAALSSIAISQRGLKKTGISPFRPFEVNIATICHSDTVHHFLPRIRMTNVRIFRQIPSPVAAGKATTGRKRKKNAKNRGKRVRSSSVRVSVRAFLYLARSCTTNTHHGNTPAIVPKTLLRHDRKKRVSPNSGCNRDTSA